MSMKKQTSKINPVCSRKEMEKATKRLHKVVEVVSYRSDCYMIGCEDCSFNFSTDRVDRRCLGGLLSEIRNRLDEIVPTIEDECGERS